jgi:hypothetical protein
MNDTTNIWDILHGIVVLLFVAVTLLLVLVTAANRFRFREVYLLWGTGRLAGIPVLPALFLCLVVPLLAFEVLNGSSRVVVHPLLLVGYVVGGVFWYMAAMISQTLMVTPAGIVRNLNRSGQAVVWSQVEDYFIDEAESRYVFIYHDATGDRRRLEFSVPRPLRGRFRQIVAEKVDARFTVVFRRAYGKRALNG